MASVTSRERKVIEFTAKTESGGRYDVWNPADRDAGVSFGLIQFNQGKGRTASPLALVFQELRLLNPAKFNEVFGPWASKIVDPAWMKSGDMNDPDLVVVARKPGGTSIVAGGRMMRAMKELPMETAQLLRAKKDYFDAAAKAAKTLGLKSQRAHAMLFDMAVQSGPANMAKIALKAKQTAGLHGLGAATAAVTAPSEKSVLEKFAVLADEDASSKIGATTDRRQKLFSNPALSDATMYGLTAGAVVAAGLATGAILWWRRRKR
jgi:hypothetical protein